MVQAIENWAWLKGTIGDVATAVETPGFCTVSLVVEEVEDEPEFPNLFTWAKGETLVVTVPDGELGERDSCEGTQIWCRVKRASPTSIVATRAVPVSADSGDG